MSASMFIIFVGISESGDALETSRFNITLSTSDFGIYSKENCLFKFFFVYCDNTGTVFVLFNYT